MCVLVENSACISLRYKHSRTGRSCQCDDPASISGTAGCHKDNLGLSLWQHAVPSAHAGSSRREPRPQCTLFRSGINRNTINQSLIIVKQNINDMNMSALATIWWHACSWGINTRTERCCQCDDPASTDGTTGCHKDNPQCHKRRRSHQTDSPVPSVHI